MSKTQVKLFHENVFMPDNVQSIVKNFQQNFEGYFLSNHFKEHLENQDKENRSHKYVKQAVIDCLSKIKDNPQEAFEVELSKDWSIFGNAKWHVTKYCCRLPYDNETDLVVAIRPQFDKAQKKFIANKNMIVTAWLNDKDDNHKTLKDFKYCTKEEWLKN